MALDPVIVGLAAMLVTFAAVVWIAVLTARQPGEGSVPDPGVSWGSLNSGTIESAVRSSLGEPDDDPALRELARHHAFAMAARGFAGERSPEGEDHADRRARLAPLFVGITRERQVSFAREKGAREDAVASKASALLEASGLVVTPNDCLGLGAAVEGGRCAVVAVVGRRIATLEAPPTRGVDAGHWSVVGRMEKGPGDAPIRAEVRRGGGPWEGSGTSAEKETRLGSPDPGRFELELDLPGGAERLDVRLLQGADEVLIVTVREG
ncbi:MAG: hypothetical protein KDA24_00850 [Deltaproteobacteria bacterium]|nr:hypothetical protein [Deltaproteobacteria bacterium]